MTENLTGTPFIRTPTGVRVMSQEVTVTQT
jgi:hypothetical protein